MNIFEAVKQSVTTRQAAESYGIRVNKNGMAVCPFHRDKNPSMKVDRRFHCFGCQADGDVIDFTAHLYNLKPKEAAEKLARDFSIHYENMGHSPPQRKQIKRQLTQEQRYLQAENRYFRALADYLHLLKQWKEECAPKQKLCSNWGKPVWKAKTIPPRNAKKRRNPSGRSDELFTSSNVPVSFAFFTRRFISTGNLPSSGCPMMSTYGCSITFSYAAVTL